MPRFIKLTREAVVGSRTYPADAIVAVDESLRNHLLASKAGEDHPGPPVDPSAARTVRKGGREQADA